MTYDNFITKLRTEAKDLIEPMKNTFTGDGEITLYKCTDFPIIENSYTVTVNGDIKTEGEDYDINLENGLISFYVPPDNEIPVVINYKFAHLTNTSWINIINKILKDMSGDFFREEYDDNFGKTEVEKYSYNAPEKCIDVVNWWYRTSQNSNWVMVNEYSNWKYSKDINKLFLGRPFYSNDYDMKLHYLKGYSIGSNLDDTLDIQEDYEGVLQLGCLWRYYDYRLSDKVEIDTKIVKESTVTSLTGLQNLSTHYYRLYLKEKGRKKPTKPLKILTSRNPQGGTP